MVRGSTPAVKNERNMWKYILTVLLFATVASADSITSGLEVGDHTPAHNPRHITGPDAGSTVCPV